MRLKNTKKRAGKWSLGLGMGSIGTVLLFCLVFTVALPGAKAHASDKEEAAFVWGTLGLGVGSSLALACMRSCEDTKLKIGSMIVLPMSTAALLGVVGQKLDLGTTAPAIISGAATTGLTMLLLGRMLEDSGPELSTLDMTLGTAGVLLGAYVGATQVNSEEAAAWMVLPYSGVLGLLGGITVIGFNRLADKPWSSKTATDVVEWSAFAGLAAGTLASYAIVLLRDDPEPAAGVPSSVRLSPFGVSGSF